MRALGPWSGEVGRVGGNVRVQGSGTTVVFDIAVMRPMVALLLMLVSWGASGQDALFLPVAQGELIENPTYVVDFDPEGRIPFWVAYELQAAEANGPAERSDNFRTDQRVSRSAPARWPGSGYDRGHMKPAGDSRSSAQEMGASFLMTNMAPQTPALNRGEWKVLEELVRAWSQAHGAVYVVMGAGSASRAVIADGVRVPTHFWKTVLRYGVDTAAVAFIFPNTMKVPGGVQDYRVTVDSVEAWAGLDLFSQLPDGTEARVESEMGAWDMGAKAAINPSPKARTAGAAQQCSGTSKSTGARCRNMTKDPSGRCHHHRN